MLHDVGHRLVDPKVRGLENTLRKELDAVFAKPKDFHPRAMKKIFRDAYTKAYQYGLWAASGGMSPNQPGVKTEDKAWLEKFIDKEYGLWKKFLDDVANKRGKLDYNRRKEMYVQALHSVYSGARVIACPPMTLYYWDTHPGEHCPHCLYLQRKSPFIKENIPTLPASGDTKCRSNCKCQLRLVQVPVWKYLKVKQNAPSREDLLRGMRVVSR
jgi:hypothetical protein